jgi:FlaA1/EpsC-like NDP-sugar epimerase
MVGLGCLCATFCVFLPLDIASIIILTILAFMIRVGLTGYFESIDIALAMAAVGLIVKIPCAYLLGLYQHAGVSRLAELLKRVTLFAITGSVITGILVLLIQRLGLVQGSFSRIIILIDLGLTIAFFGISRSCFKCKQVGHCPDPNESLCFISTITGSSGSATPWSVEVVLGAWRHGRTSSLDHFSRQ